VIHRFLILSKWGDETDIFVNKINAIGWIRYNTPMQDSDEFWDFYWEVHLQNMEDLGKREAILAISRLIRCLAVNPDQRVRLLELGCGEGQIIGALAKAHAQVPSINASQGVDYSPKAIKICRRLYPGMTFTEGNFTHQDLMTRLGQFEIVLLVNALHEVFSADYSLKLGEVAVEQSKLRVEQALICAVEHLEPGGYLVLFDGLESCRDIQEWIRIRFRHWQARRRFETFAHEYRPFRISNRETGDPFVVELSYHNFTRYITKSIFLDKHLWQTERLESYQYFNETEFRQVFARLGLVIDELHTLTVNYEKWRSEVEIETAAADFPVEHIMILARKPGLSE
jgi:SAM-dependent methyltransferase